MKITDLFKKLIRDEAQDFADATSTSTIIRDNEVVQRFISSPENTLLVSFPRTGSHWLRMLMELYFERPTLKLVFYYPQVTDYLAYHTHDLNLDIEHPTILYLYRDPVDTIYSQISYHKEKLGDASRIAYWADLYGRHLDKWLHREGFTVKKTILRYEGLKYKMADEFSKVTRHFGVELDDEKLARAKSQTTKEEIKRRTGHDQKVINTRADYEISRDAFQKKHRQLIWDTLLKGREHLKADFL